MANESKIKRLPGAAVGQEYLAGALLERVKLGTLSGFIIIEVDKENGVCVRWPDGLTFSQMCYCSKVLDIKLHELFIEDGGIVGG